jgi:hypothetical protein
MNKIIAFLDEQDTEEFKGLSFPIVYCKSFEEFRSLLSYDYEEENLHNLIIFSSRLVKFYYKKLNRLINAHSNIIFRVFEIKEFEEIDDYYHDLNDFKINVVNNLYSIKDVINEFTEQATLKLSRATEAKRKPEQSILTYLDPLFPNKGHLKLNNTIIT